MRYAGSNPGQEGGLGGFDSPCNTHAHTHICTRTHLQTGPSPTFYRASFVDHWALSIDLENGSQRGPQEPNGQKKVNLQSRTEKTVSTEGVRVADNLGCQKKSLQKGKPV